MRNRIRIRISRIRMFLGLLYPHPDPLVTSTDESFHQQAKIVRKTLVPTVLYCGLLYDFLSLKNDINVPALLGLPDQHSDPLVRGTDPRSCNRIQIRTKMSQICNTAKEKTRVFFHCCFQRVVCTVQCTLT